MWYSQEMTADQVQVEKQAIQKALLQFEKLHGRPVSQNVTFNSSYKTAVSVLWLLCIQDLQNCIYVQILALFPVLAPETGNEARNTTYM